MTDLDQLAARIAAMPEGRKKREMQALWQQMQQDQQ